MNRDVAGYLAWLDAGNRSEHLDRVRAAVTVEPMTRREIAERADVSVSFAGKALSVLVILGEVDERGARGVRRGKFGPAKLYAARREVAA